MSQIKSWPAEANESCISSGTRLRIPNSKLIKHRAIRDKEKQGVLLLFSKHLVLCFHKMGMVLFIQSCKGLNTPHAELQWHFFQSTEPYGPFAQQDRTNPLYTSDISQQRGLSLLAQANYLISSIAFLIITMITRELGRQAFYMLNPSCAQLQSAYNTFYEA